MKAILISIRPQWVAKILNGEKTIEIRKRFPKDYVGWVYIYCTKAQSLELYYLDYNGDRVAYFEDKGLDLQYAKQLNGKVVARFWCEVEEITTRQDRFKEFMFYETSLDMEDLLKQSCLDYNELDNYLYGENGYAIHITKLEIFDEPKEISEFNHYTTKRDTVKGIIHDYEELTRAPQSWCYIEI